MEKYHMQLLQISLVSTNVSYLDIFSPLYLSQMRMHNLAFRCLLSLPLFFPQWIIIPLLSSAVAQFKKYKSPRMRRHLSKLHTIDT